MTFKFESKAIWLAKLTEEEIVDLANFNCGDEEMNDFLKNEAYEEQECGMNTTIIRIQPLIRQNMRVYKFTGGGFFARLPTVQKDLIHPHLQFLACFSSLHFSACFPVFVPLIF